MPNKGTPGCFWVGEGEQSELRVLFRAHKKIFEGKSEFQHIALYETEDFGRILILDDAIQLTERDEYTYHEMLVHPPAFSIPELRNVLIIGGGDGGAAREALVHGPERVDVVEIDPKVIEIARRYLPFTSRAYSDPKVNIVIADGISYVRRAKIKYDLVIVDSTDPVGPAKALLTESFYRDVRHILSQNGVVVAQSGSPLDVSDDQTAITYAIFNRVFKHTALYLAHVPMYPYSMWAFVAGSGAVDISMADEMELKKKYEDIIKAGHEFRYYNPTVHMAAFALPNYVKKRLDL